MREEVIIREARTQDICEVVSQRRHFYTELGERDIHALAAALSQDDKSKERLQRGGAIVHSLPALETRRARACLRTIQDERLLP